MVKLKRLAAITATLICAAPASAHAATIVVAADGADTPTCTGTSPTSACLTVAYAVTNAISGDNINIGAGTFPVPETANAATKSLTISGAGEGVTTLDGQGNPSLDGILRFTGGTQSVSSVTFANSRYGIVAGSDGDGTAPVALTVGDTTFAGAAANGAGIHSVRNSGALDIHGSTFNAFAGPAIQLVQQTGSVSLIGNQFKTTGTDCAVSVKASTGIADISQAYGISFNSFSGKCGVGVEVNDVAFTVGFVISSNLFVFNTAGDTGTAVQIANTTAAADGGNGDIRGLGLSDNIMTGGGTTGTGIEISGRLTSPAISHNNIRNYATGVAVLPAASGHGATGVNINRNQLVDDAAAGVTAQTASSPVDATGNWWGCNAGPGSAGCSAVTGTGAVNATPRLVASISANPTAVPIGGTSAVTVDLGHDSAGNAISVFENGREFGFSATGGSVSPTSSTTYLDQLTTTFTAASFPATVSAVIDHQTVTGTFTEGQFVTVTPPVTTTTPPASANANDTLLSCAKSAIAITDISRRDGRVRILGVTTKANAGQRVRIAFKSASNIVATTTAAADGSFRATAPLPKKAVASLDSSRYRATVTGKSVTPWLKYTRRLTLAGLHKEGDSDLVASGSLTGPLIKGAKIVVTTQSDCAKAPVTIANVVIDSDKTFYRALHIPENVTGIVVRLALKVRNPSGKGTSTTYSIARPIQMR